MPQQTLSDRVRDRLTSPEQDASLSAPELVEAMRLSDLYEAVQPQVYVLPLDAMAGFPTSFTPPESKDK
jgi:hypothetical protein